MVVVFFLPVVSGTPSMYIRLYLSASLNRTWPSNTFWHRSTAQVDLVALGRAGLGHKTIGDAAKVSFSTVRKVLDGRRQHLRETTARRLLEVTREALADSALVPAGPTWALLEELLDEGYTRTDLARRLGNKAKRPTIQIRRGKVEAATAARVERLHRQLTR